MHLLFKHFNRRKKKYKHIQHMYNIMLLWWIFPTWQLKIMRLFWRLLCYSKFQLDILLMKLILITVFPWLLSIYQIIDNPQNVFHVNNFTLKKGRKVLNIFLKRDPDTDRAENLIKWHCYFVSIEDWVSSQTSLIWWHPECYQCTDWHGGYIFQN